MSTLIINEAKVFEHIGCAKSCARGSVGNWGSASRNLSRLLLMSGIIAFTGCTTNKLIPASDAQRVSGMENAARSEVSGVHVLVQDTQWLEDADISEELTPLRVEIENRGETPIRISYSAFGLVNSGLGEENTALPLHRIEGTVEEPVAVEVIDRPGFVYSNFAVAPYLRDIYPGMRPSALPFHYDRNYYRDHITVWETTELPTHAMRVNALPEGVLEPGGEVDGWLYFEKISGTEEVVFRTEVVSAETGKNLGQIKIPFDVQ